MPTPGPWFRPLPIGGTIKTVTNNTELLQAIGSLKAGDFIKLKAGIYDPWPDPAVPIELDYMNTVLYSDEGAILKKRVHLMGDNSWLYGCRFDISGAGNYAEMRGNNCGVVNNIIFGDGVSLGSVGIFSGAGKNQLSYGNIVRGTQHGIYVQNTSPDGVEFVVGNYLGDVVNYQNAAAFHAYAESANKVELIQFHKNIFANARGIIGGSVNATIPLHNVFKDNWFYKMSLEHYKRPQCTDMEFNKFINSVAKLELFFGVSEGINPGSDTSFIRRNSFYNPGGQQVRLQTSGYNAAGVRYDHGEPKLRTIDTFDDNDYFGGFHNYFAANNNVQASVTRIEDWRNYSNAAGKQLDATSRVHSGPPPNMAELIPNEYDNNRGMLVCWNGNGLEFEVDLGLMGSLAPISSPDGFGQPSQKHLILAEGFSVYAVKFSATQPEPEPNLECIAGKAKVAKAKVLLDSWLAGAGAGKNKVKQARDILGQAIIELGKCK